MRRRVPSCYFGFQEAGLAMLLWGENGIRNKEKGMNYQESYLCVHSNECVLIVSLDLEFSLMISVRCPRHALVILRKTARLEPLSLLFSAMIYPL